MKKELATIISDFSYRDEHYTIVFDGTFYSTINHKFIGADGNTIRTLTYLDGLHPGKTLDETIKLTKWDLDMKYYESHGFSKAEAYSMVTGVRLEIAKMCFDNFTT